MFLRDPYDHVLLGIFKMNSTELLCYFNMCNKYSDVVRNLVKLLDRRRCFVVFGPEKWSLHFYLQNGITQGSTQV